MSAGEFWKIATDTPVDQLFTYRIPDELRDCVSIGQFVTVPLGRGGRNVSGVLLEKELAEPEFESKAIKEIQTEFPILPQHFIDWCQWLAKYYLHPIGEVLHLSLPPLSKKNSKKTKKSDPSMGDQEKPHRPKPELSSEQTQVLDSIQKSHGFQTHLLFGVTGSGKTEVYMHLLEKILRENQSAIVIVPEISLTPQLINRFVDRFGKQIAVLHSQLTPREKTNQWWDMIEGRKKIVIGARSALFCPLPNLGMIIVDEEHESSFKQDEKLKYHGRDAAVMLGKFHNCPVVLGSATPSLESWHNCLQKKYQLHVMENRVMDRQLPLVEIVDLRNTPKENHDLRPSWCSPLLFEKIHETLERGDQVALFLNRRGVAPFVLCPACGHTRECPNCDISLTLHGKSHLVCHYCDYHENLKSRCPDCHEDEMKPVGLGTEAIENDMKRLYPDRRVVRADRDEIQDRVSLENFIRQMESGAVDILIGTQMIAKGLDFPKLTLVGLVLADIGFHLPDFRSTERSFQILTQVSGRSGRHVQPGQSPGHVIIQTLSPEHPSIQFAQNHDFQGFAQHELEFRRMLGYPPLGKLVSLRVQGTHLDRVQHTARLLSERAWALKSQRPQFENLEILGPTEAPLAKLRGQFRHLLLIKNPQGTPLSNYCVQLLSDQKWVPAGVRIIVDVDPLHLL
jgi:primosomal protein N' (replication factor Y)